MRDRIIDYIRRNRVSTTEVADCLNKTGNLEMVYALNRGHFVVGPVHWAYALDGSNWTIHHQIQEVEEGSVVLLSAIKCGSRALIGDLVSKYLLLYQQARGIVIDGYVRDAPRLIKENWPIWCLGTNPVGCFNTDPVRAPTPEELMVGERYDGAIAVCDDCGVVVVERQFQTEQFLEKLCWIEEQEDTWYECVDRKKWSTFDTVCRKRYLEGGEGM
jgi:regulator of RNase E activity RraA